jgi:fructoselysine-6-P-deglycase FrlB-like protein
VNELMRNEIVDQPEALTRCLPSLRTQATGLVGCGRELVFTGSGDSYFAPLALQFAARQHLAVPVTVLPGLQAARYYPYGRDAVVVTISVSGEGAGAIETARAARAAGALVLAISAEPQSALTRTADRSLVLEFRSRSRRTPHTTDFMTTLLALAVVIEALAGRPVDVLDGLATLVGDLVVAPEPEHGLAAHDRFVLLGAGPSLGVAHYAAAKFWEAGGLDARAYDLVEFAHGPHLLVDEGDPVVLVAPAGRSSARARDIAAGLADIGARVVWVTDSRSLPEEWSPFATTVAVQQLCWAVATAKGYDVVRKDGRHADPAPYERARERWANRDRAQAIASCASVAWRGGGSRGEAR